jgi:hypothetical protein
MTLLLQLSNYKCQTSSIQRTKDVTITTNYFFCQKQSSFQNCPTKSFPVFQSTRLRKSYLTTDFFWTLVTFRNFLACLCVPLESSIHLKTKNILWCCQTFSKKIVFLLFCSTATLMWFQNLRWLTAHTLMHSESTQRFLLRNILKHCGHLFITQLSTLVLCHCLILFMVYSQHSFRGELRYIFLNVNSDSNLEDRE